MSFVGMNVDNMAEMPLSGRKGKTCSMTGCHNTHQRCPNMSFFRFPKELARAIEWLTVCDRPDLMRRIEINDININNYYVCEAHFPNQILDYTTRKILIKTAKPLSVAELETMPAQNRYITVRPKQALNYDEDNDQDYDEDDYEDSKDNINFLNAFTPQVVISKMEGNYQSELLEPLLIQDEDCYIDDQSKGALFWTPEATRYLIKLRGDRDAEFEQSGARKSQLWIEISNKMSEAGYDFSTEKVSKKWHNITITYHKNLEKKHGSINWEFFDDMHVIMKNRKHIEENSTDAIDDEVDPQQNGFAKRRHDNMDRDSQSPVSDQSYRRVTREFKRKKTNADDKSSHPGAAADNGVAAAAAAAAFNDAAINVPPQNLNAGIDENWWKEYFERKLELEREKLAKEDDRHKDRMNFQKMAIMLQERVEKVKVEAINNLTNALLRLQEK